MRYFLLLVILIVGCKKSPKSHTYTCTKQNTYFYGSQDAAYLGLHGYYRSTHFDSSYEMVFSDTSAAAITKYVTIQPDNFIFDTFVFGVKKGSGVDTNIYLSRSTTCSYKQ